MSLLNALARLVRGKRKAVARRAEKLRLYSMRRIDDKTIFKIEKRQDFFVKFRMLLKNIGFKEASYWHYDPSKLVEGNISHLVNFCDEFNNRNYDMDIIFTLDRVLVILRSSAANRMRFVEELMKFCEWDNPGPVLRRS
jgi:hypothetical protein